jgi:hypothetical protein
MRLGMKAGREIFEARYQQAGRKDKGNILDGLAGTTGLHRDRLARVLAGCRKKPAAKGGRAARAREAGAGQARREAATVSGQGVCVPSDARPG